MTDIYRMNQTVSQFCSGGETVLNVLECVPFIGIVSSSVRIQLGCIQEIAAVVTLIAGGIGLLGSTFLYKNEASKKRYTFVIHMGTEHLLHGALNILRGYAGLFLSGFSLGIGNLLMIIPNKIKAAPFEPAFVYGSFTDSTTHFNPKFFNSAV